MAAVGRRRGGTSVESNWIVLPIVVGVLGGGLALGAGLYAARRLVRRSRSAARALLADARAEADSRQKEILVAAQELSLIHI